ncbi:hypothetical protein [Streptomyces sp. 2231.1]|uniref:hypothetical protein n=1 Tax=Streptomyces sp. 2231.1 TaxID=1855347 RepID=UPI00115FB527|nr:hypothetical protein [Streptomyces sp. 2231.1]
MELERFIDRLLTKDPAQRPVPAGTVRDVLKEINDRHFGATPPSRGKDIATEVLVTQAEATDGAIIPLQITARNACPACATRTDEKAAQSCTTCKGEVRIVRKQHTYKVRIPAGLKEVRIRELGGPARTAVRPETCTSPCTSSTDQPSNSGVRSFGAPAPGRCPAGRGGRFPEEGNTVGRFGEPLRKHLRSRAKITLLSTAPAATNVNGLSVIFSPSTSGSLIGHVSGKPCHRRQHPAIRRSQESSAPRDSTEVNQPRPENRGSCTSRQ